MSAVGLSQPKGTQMIAAEGNAEILFLAMAVILGGLATYFYLAMQQVKDDHHNQALRDNRVIAEEQQRRLKAEQELAEIKNKKATRQ